MFASRLFNALLWIASLILLGDTAIAKSYNIDQRSQQQYQEALQHLSKNELDKAKVIYEKLNHYPLADYLEFHFYRQLGNDLKSHQVHDFIGQYRGSWLAERMRKHWLNSRMLRGDYQGFIDYFDPVEDSGHKDAQCFVANAYFATGRIDRAIEQTQKLWLSSKSQPDLCDDAFDQLKRRKLLSQSLIFQRLLLSYQANQWSMVRYLQNLIEQPEYKIKLNNLHRARNKATRLLTMLNNKSLDEDYRAMMHYIIGRQVKLDANKAYDLWSKIAAKVDLPKRDHRAMLSAICSRKSTILLYQRCLKIAKLRPDDFPLKAIQAQIELALTLKNWQLVQSWINRLPADKISDDKWQYWLARSYQYLGEVNSAKLIFERLAEQTSYYGFLSTIHVNKPIKITQKVRAVDKQTIRAISDNRLVQRAIELHSIGHSLHSRQEWLYAMRTLNQQQLLAAAEIGTELGWAYASISAMKTAKFWDEIHYRFPVDHFDDFNNSADKTKLNVSWLLGLSRKESNFIADMKSYAGAIGVMQVMPVTAREMAAKVKIPYRRNQLSDPATNIKLGSTYLDLASDTFNGNPSYTSAAYNAGIYRIKTWLDKERSMLPIDIWTDTIPNAGVQDYVRSVMQFSVFYADRLGVESPLISFGHSWFSAPVKPFSWQPNS